jgi:hypothetical protein
LQGQAGPPLKGKPLASNLRYSKISAQQLFDFIKQHMPKNSPGSLTDQQYRRVFAYILSQNGYPKGDKPLTKTGKKLWRYNLGAGVNAPPIAYEVKGKQYVAVAAGGNYQLNFPRGDIIAIYSLSKTAQQQARKWRPAMFAPIVPRQGPRGGRKAASAEPICRPAFAPI